jgi:hypothetical protein
MAPKGDKVTSRGRSAKVEAPASPTASVRQTERVLRLRRHLAQVRAEPTTTLSGTNLETNLVELLDVVVPSFCDWCVIDLASPHGAQRRFAVRHNGCNHASRENEIEACCIEGLDQRVPNLAAITARVLASGATEAWPSDGSRPACCVVVALKLNDLPFAAISFVTDERHAGYEAYEIATASGRP